MGSFPKKRKFIQNVLHSLYGCGISVIPRLQTGCSVKVPNGKYAASLEKWPTFPVLHAGVKQKTYLKAR